MKPSMTRKPRETNRTPNTSKNNGVTCYNCKKTRHISTKCPQKLTAPKNTRAVHETIEEEQEAPSSANVEEQESPSDGEEANECASNHDSERDSAFQALRHG